MISDGSDLLGASYRLEGRAAAGAHGQVWRGTQVRSQTPVAVKFLDVSNADFEREAAAVARMDHPHIVPILDLGHRQHEGRRQNYLVMPWAEQGTLAEAARVEVSTVARQLLDALAHAHARGVVHLDLKPANVLMRHGDVWLTDFSIARVDHEQITQLRGTPRYMAPEQFLGTGIGPWSDRYGLGCLLYELLCGHSPFRAPTHREVGRLHLESQPPPLPDSVPSGLAAVIERLLSKAPADRFGSDREARLALEDASDSMDARCALDDGTETLTTSSLPMWNQVQAAPEAQTLPVPEDWRTAAQPFALSKTPTGDSVALLRLRSTATVGRVVERDRLWRELRETAQARTSRVVLLTGLPGVGLSHLAAWVRIHAVELGVAVEVQLGSVPPSGAVGVVVVDDADRVAQQRVVTALAAHSQEPLLYVVVCRERRHPALEAFGAVELELTPLTREEHAEFLAAVLQTEPTLGARFYEHSAGLPERTVRLAARWLREGALEATEGELEVSGQDLDILTVLACFEGPAPLEDWERGCALLGVANARARLPQLHDLVRTVGKQVVWIDPNRRMSLQERAVPVMRTLAEAGVGAERERARWWVRAGEGVRGGRMLLDLAERLGRTRRAMVRPLLAWAQEGFDAGQPTEADRQRLTYLRIQRLISARDQDAASACEGPEIATLAAGEQALLRAWWGLAEGRAEDLRDVALDLMQRSQRPFVRVTACFFGGYGAASAGDVQGMQRLFLQGAWLAEEAGLHEWAVGCLTDIAGWAGRLQVPEVGGLYAQMALAAATDHGFDELAGYAKLNLGEGLRAEGDLQGAEAYFRSAELQLEACGSVASAHARMLRLLLLLETEPERPLRVQFTSLRRLFDSFRTGAGPASQCAAAEALCAFREQDAERGHGLAAALCDRLEHTPPFGDLSPLLALLAPLVEPETRQRLEHIAPSEDP